jgi:hypothetical protein
MKIAVSGAHATGKSTLVAALATALPDYQVFEELYYELLATGVVGADPPQAEDFQLLLDRSLAQLLASSGPNVLFDRCPLDYLACLIAVAGAPTHRDLEWERVATALARLDLLVFVPIEQPDPIGCPTTGRPRLRLRVHRLLEDILGAPGVVPVPVLPVTGSVEDRVAQVRTRIGTSPV